MAFFCTIRISDAIAGGIDSLSLPAGYYIALGVIIIDLGIYILYRRFYKYFLFFTLFLGLFNVIKFSTVDIAIGFSISGHGVDVQLLALLDGLLVYAMNYRRINDFIADKIAPSPEALEKLNKAEWTDAVGKFKDRYDRYSTDELREILAEHKYVPEALEAAKQIINERQINDLDGDLNPDG